MPYKQCVRLTKVPSFRERLVLDRRKLWNPSSERLVLVAKLLQM
jgi:hypothetical protein